MKKCNKCDDRGMIADKEIKGAAHSCGCGYDNYLMEQQFKGVSIKDLLNYATRRMNDKENGRSLIGGLLGSIKSKRKAKSSRENGKLGGRPKKV